MPDRYSIHIVNVQGTPHAHHVNRLRWLQRVVGLQESSFEVAQAVLRYAHVHGRAFLTLAAKATAEDFLTYAHERNEDSDFLFDVELRSEPMPTEPTPSVNKPFAAVSISNVQGPPHAHHVNRLRWLQREAGMIEHTYDVALEILQLARADGRAFVGLASADIAERFVELTDKRNHDSKYLFTASLGAGPPALDPPPEPVSNRAVRTYMLDAVTALERARRAAGAADQALIGVALAAVEAAREALR